MHRLLNASLWIFQKNWMMMINDDDQMMMIRSTGKFQYSPLENSADNSLLKVLPNRLPA